LWERRKGFLKLPKREYYGKCVECVQGEKRGSEKESWRRNYKLRLIRTKNSKIYTLLEEEIHVRGAVLRVYFNCIFSGLNGMHVNLEFAKNMINCSCLWNFRKPSGDVEDPSGDACCKIQFLGFLYEPPSGCMCPARRRELVWPVSRGFMIFYDVDDAWISYYIWNCILVYLVTCL